MSTVQVVPETKSLPKVDIDATRDRLLRLGLARAAETVGEHLSRAVKDSTAPHKFLDRFLDEEIQWREERRIKGALRLSGLPTGQTLASFDFSFQPSVERSRIETIATCDGGAGRCMQFALKYEF